MKVRLVTNILNDLMGMENEIDLHDNKNVTLKHLFQHLIELYGERVRERILIRGEIAPYVTVMINGEAIDLTECMDHPLRERDQVNLLTAIVAGG